MTSGPKKQPDLRINHGHFMIRGCAKSVWTYNEEGLENLARYIIQASFSSERMTYISATDTKTGAAKVILSLQERGFVQNL